MSRSLRIKGWRFVKATGRHTALPRSSKTLTTHWRDSGSNYVIASLAKPTRDKLQLQPSTMVPILDHSVCDVVGEGAGVLMRVVRIAHSEVESSNYRLDLYAIPLVSNFTTLIHLQSLTCRC